MVTSSGASILAWVAVLLPGTSAGCFILCVCGSICNASFHCRIASFPCLFPKLLCRFMACSKAGEISMGTRLAVDEIVNAH